MNVNCVKRSTKIFGKMFIIHTSTCRLLNRDEKVNTDLTDEREALEAASIHPPKSVILCKDFSTVVAHRIDWKIGVPHGIVHIRPTGPQPRG